jgi:hypothetical protein
VRGLGKRRNGREGDLCFKLFFASQLPWLLLCSSQPSSNPSQPFFPLSAPIHEQESLTNESKEKFDLQNKLQGAKKEAAEAREKAAEAAAAAAAAAAAGNKVRRRCKGPGISRLLQCSSFLLMSLAVLLL